MDSTQRPKRTSNACQRCRSRKVKCSGTQPCDKCHQRQQDCVFEEDRKIVVSEQFFLSLKRKVEAIEGAPATAPSKRCRTLASESVNDSSYTPEIAVQSTPEIPESDRYDERFASNELVSPSLYVKHTDKQRAWLFLGPTSTWSFSRRILNIIQSRLNPTSSRAIPLAVDGDAHQLHWRRASSDEAPDVSALPSLEHALYMVKTVQFHFGHLYRLFDEDEFLRHLHEFYKDAAGKLQESRLWYVQFLVILAFGEAFCSPVRKASNTASWTKYFSRAMSLLPDITGLWQQPTLAIEVLALIALYFHSVDMRDTAYCYIGHSMRMALVEGLHRTQPVEQLGLNWVTRRSNIWWTVYILDRKFSALIGSPNSVNDDEITSILWDLKTCSKAEAALSLHVKISQVISRVLNTVYSADGKLGGVFLRKIQSILREMTNLCRELESVFSHHFSTSVDTLSNVTTRLTLSCHLCVIVTTRPLVLSLLWERLNCFEDGDTFRSLSDPVRTLLQACTDTAVKSLKILSALRDQNLLETFLPFDLENLFSSSFILTLISAIIPDILPDTNYRDLGFSLLDEMISRGNRVAHLRKSEIELLEELVQPLIQAPVHNQRTWGNLTRPLSIYVRQDHPQRPGNNPIPPLEVEDRHTPPALPNPIAPAEDELLFDWGYLDHMLSAADQLNANNSVLDGEHQEIQADLWLWSDN
ncbi:hypothetical protein AOCH_002780 [Aspergillus ochraceoroseus]|uniref:Zn(2)-C6 fungal-type domain-containing protein n=1 Tax=Aspergillus ochraceoroseus TaxID=138278 RepID=A0A0F8X2W9_9EURO|nr:hypothetical protein AOCH_002780 [Aspergillus ochraceoroseus]